MAIHESLSLMAYTPLFGFKKLGYFYGGGDWNETYFQRNSRHCQIVFEGIQDLIRARFVSSRNLVFVQSWFEFDRDWNCFHFFFLLDSNMSYPSRFSVTVYCPALTPQIEGAGVSIKTILP